MIVRPFWTKEAPTWRRGLAVAAVVSLIAWGLRISAGPLLQDRLPYLIAFFAGLMAAVLGGRAAGLLTAAACGLSANWSFVGRPGAFDVAGPNGWSLLVYLVLSGSMVLVGDGLASALRREAALNATLELLSGELQHRAKNSGALIQSLIVLTGKNASSVKDFQAKLTDRVHALVRAQSLIDQTSGKPASLKAVLTECLGPFDTDGRIAGGLDGPDAPVSAPTAVALSLLLHELATNSMKYGALSDPAGRLFLTWTVGPGGVTMLWRESGGPTVTPPTKLGFGSRLFGAALPGGRVHVAYEPDGVRCEIAFPLT